MRGYAYGELAYYQQAMKDFNRAIEIAPKSVLTWVARGVIAVN